MYTCVLKLDNLIKEIITKSRPWARESKRVSFYVSCSVK